MEKTPLSNRDKALYKLTEGVEKFSAEEAWEFLLVDEQQKSLVDYHLQSSEGNVQRPEAEVVDVFMSNPVNLINALAGQARRSMEEGDELSATFFNKLASSIEVP